MLNILCERLNYEFIRIEFPKFVDSPLITLYMKRLLLVFCISLGFIISSHGQTIGIYDASGSRSIVNDTTTFWHPVDASVTESDFSHTGFAKIVNLKTTGAMTIELRRIERQIISGSYDYLCWGTTCFGSYNAGDTVDWYVDDRAVVNPGDTAGGTGLVVYLQPNDNVGTAVYEYLFYNQENPSESASTFVKWSISQLTDINDIAKAIQKMDVYPNPATNQFTVDLNTGIKAANQQIIIRDMLGKIVRRENISSLQETFRFSTENLNKGVYFISYVLNGEVLKTNKLVVR